MHLSLLDNPCVKNILSYYATEYNLGNSKRISAALNERASESISTHALPFSQGIGLAIPFPFLDSQGELDQHINQLRVLHTYGFHHSRELAERRKARDRIRLQEKNLSLI